MHRSLALFIPFLRCLAVVTLGSAAVEAQTVPLRLVTANLTSGDFQAYDLPSVSRGGEGARILAGLDGDVVLLQEFNYGNNSANELRNFVDATFGSEFSYARETNAAIPNGVISRYPILASGEWDDPQVGNRDFVWARIDVPGVVDLWVVSVHLLTDTSRHSAEGNALLSKINANVPAGAYLAIGGDFNSTSRTDAALNALSAVVRTSSPYPVDQNGNADTNANRTEPYDAIYVDNDLHTLRLATAIGGFSFASGAVVDTRVFGAKGTISAISPARTGDSGAAMMQHMAVVRDFALPVPEPGVGVMLATGLLVLIRRRRPAVGGAGVG